jgi:nucleotide-binding universal stress UspA family protein
MTTVLAALGANASARPVLETAITIAALFDATPTALHVRETRASAAENLASALGIELREVTGSPIDQIIAAAQDPDVAALVLGARGAHGGPQPAGHIALDIITRVPKPVVVVPPDAEPPEKLARILVPLEGGSESSHALDDAIEMARRGQLEILVLHIHSPATVPAFSDHEPHATRAWDQEFLMRHISGPHERVRLVRRMGVPADDIVAVARETAVDLIVLAWSQNLGRGHAHVVSETLAHSSVPVLLLPVLPSQRRGNRRERLGRSPHVDSAPGPDAIPHR